jgi:hypothetical protein
MVQVPVGQATLGRIINVIGEAIDERGDIKNTFLGFIMKLRPSLNKGQNKKFWREELRLWTFWHHISMVARLVCLVELGLVKQCSSWS